MSEYLFFPEALQTTHITEEHIYENIVPFLESRGIHMSDVGINVRPNQIKTYKELKSQRKLFNIPSINKALFHLPSLLVACRTSHSSYGIKNNLPREHYYMNGDFVLALLCLGHATTTQKQKQRLMNPLFKLQLNK